MKQLISIFLAILLLAGCGSAQAFGDGQTAKEAGSFQQIDQETAKEMMTRDDGHVIVDVRRQDEYDSGHIPGAILIPNESIGCDAPEALPDYDQIILIYCRSGNRSKEAAKKLASIGYKNVYEFGGINTWAGEIVTGPDQLPVSYEIHFLLDSEQVLDDDHQLKQEFRDIFETTEKLKKYSLAFMDTPDRGFFREQWINRVRIRDGKAEKGFELTYKKRHKVTDDDVAAAMRLAESEGFDLSGETWEAEVEWSYSEMVLSLSAECKYDAGGRESVADLNAKDAAAMLADKMPAEEKNWTEEGWGTRMMESARMAGPVFFQRYTGQFHGVKVQVEVWELPDKGDGPVRYITELSFKEDNFGSAAEGREKMKESLTELGILVPEDALKTRQILDAYFEAS